MRFRFSLRFLLVIMFVLALFLSGAVSVHSPGEFVFMGSGAFDPSGGKWDLEDYVQLLERDGFTMVNVLDGGPSAIRAVKQEQRGWVTIDVRIQERRIDMYGTWKGSWGIVDMFDSQRKNKLGALLRDKYIESWKRFTDKTR